MQQITLSQPGSLLHSDGPEPGPPGRGEALVHVHAVGICGTDIHAFHGRQPFFSYPRILGHELGVEVLALGPGADGPQVGDRCAVEPYLNCGACVACRRGRPNCCVGLRVLGVHIDGGMRERILLPAAKLHPAAGLSFAQLALVETLAIGAHAAQRAALEPGEQALVIGAGPIGLSVMQFARLAGAQVIALDTSAERLAFCRARGLADHSVLADQAALAQIEALTAGDLPTAVFDATGSARSMCDAMGYVAHGGRLIFVGLVQGEVSFSDPLFHRREIALLATRNAAPADFGRIIGQIRSGAIDTGPWITHRATAADLAELFPLWLMPGSGLLKGVVSFAPEA